MAYKSRFFYFAINKTMIQKKNTAYKSALTIFGQVIYNSLEDNETEEALIHLSLSHAIYSSSIIFLIRGSPVRAYTVTFCELGITKSHGSESLDGQTVLFVLL